MADDEGKNRQSLDWQLDVAIYLSSNPRVKNMYEPGASPEASTFTHEHGIQLWGRYGRAGQQPTEIELRGSYTDLKIFVTEFLSGDDGDEFRTVEEAQGLMTADKGRKVWVLFPRDAASVHPAA